MTSSMSKTETDRCCPGAGQRCRSASPITSMDRARLNWGGGCADHRRSRSEMNATPAGSKHSMQEVQMALTAETLEGRLKIFVQERGEGTRLRRFPGRDHR